jgi:hypothetical protein
MNHCPAKKGDVHCVRPRGHEGPHYGTNWVDGTCKWDEDVPEEPPVEVKPPPKTTPRPKDKRKAAKTTRYCPECDKELPVEEFYKSGRRYQRLCKFHDNRRAKIKSPSPGRCACTHCYDMSWRRPKDKPCSGCGKEYSEEVVERVPYAKESNWDGHR